MRRNYAAGITVGQAARLAGVSPPVLNYWLRLGIVKASQQAAGGRGVWRLLNVRDVTILRVVASLRQHGIPLQRLRKVASALRRRGVDFASARLLLAGGDVLLLAAGQTPESVLRKPGQQSLFTPTTLLELDRLAQDTEVQVKEIEAAKSAG